jgi:adenine-specific DNA glycosylase
VICRAESPHCHECPVRARCSARGGFTPAPQLVLSGEFSEDSELPDGA